ncbi:unnamed protein product [Hermetia illucens]|uniref:Peptidase A2 domain-containing protein n=1 Tax=Hermetia illucens TaxID=343691 RepID=A0A7R8UGA0_HERIL|nr:unnamed protein product [Hermetia illucens]
MQLIPKEGGIGTSSVGTTTAPLLAGESSHYQPVWLATARVTVKTVSSGSTTLRALVDTGSQRCLITELAVQLLGLNRRLGDVQISGLGAASTVNLQMETKIGDEMINVLPVIVGIITNICPGQN